MPETRQRNKKLALQLSAITGFQILVSFGMQWYVITYFGAGVRTDALYTGATIPQLLTILFIESLTVVIVPLFATSSEAELEERGWFLFICMGILFLAISGILFLTLPVLIPLIVPGFSPIEKQITISLAQIQVFGLVGAACYAVLASMYQARERFMVPPATVLFSGITSFVLLAWRLPRFGIVWAAWMQVFNIILPAILLLPALGSIRRVKPQRELVRETWGKIRPLLLSKTYYMTSAPLDRILASFLAPGSIAIFELAGRFYNAVIRILSQGVVTPFIPHLSRLAHEQNWAEFRTQYRKQLILVCVPSAAVMTAVLVGGGVGLRLLPSNSTQHVVGSLNVESLSKLFHVMVYMSGLLPCMAFVNSLVNGYYAKGDTRTPTVVGVCAFTVGMGVKVAGYYAGGIMGMALAVSVYAAIYCIILCVILEQQTTRLLAAKDVNPSASRLAPAEPSADTRPVMRSLHVIAGDPEGSVMIFAKRESKSLRHAGITVRQFFLRSRTSPIRVVQEFFRLRREIRDFRPHMIHAHYGTVTALLCGLATTLPLVITFRGSDLNPDPTISRLRFAVGHLFSQLGALRASQIICVTKALKHRLWWRQGRVHVIPACIDLQLFRPQPIEEARAALGWPADKKTVMFNAGRSPQIKRLDLAEKAIEAANKLGCRARMVVLNGETASDEIPLYLNAADCLLITSDWEGSPYIVKEALSCELPIVSVDVGDVAESIAGVIPSRIVPREAGALGEALAEVLSLGRRSNGRLAVQDLSEPRVAERVRSIYEQVVPRERVMESLGSDRRSGSPEAGRA